MNYVTQQQLVDRFGETELIQLTDRANSGVIDAAVLASKIADSDALIDGYLQPRYTLPLSVVPASLVRIAADIVRYDLQADRATEQVTKRFTDAMKFLRDVADGKTQLGTDAASVPVPTSDGAQFTSPDRLFTQDTLADYSE